MGEVAIKLSTGCQPTGLPSRIPYLTRSGRLMQWVMVYVVGFNLYYRLLAKGRRRYCWLDPSPVSGGVGI